MLDAQGMLWALLCCPRGVESARTALRSMRSSASDVHTCHGNVKAAILCVGRPFQRDAQRVLLLFVTELVCSGDFPDLYVQQATLVRALFKMSREVDEQHIIVLLAFLQEQSAHRCTPAPLPH